MRSPCFVLYEDQFAKEYTPDFDLWKDIWDESWSLRIPYQYTRIYCPIEKPGELAHWHLIKSERGVLEILTVKVAEKGLMDFHTATLQRIKMDGIRPIKDAVNIHDLTSRLFRSEPARPMSISSLMCYRILDKRHVGLCGKKDDFVLSLCNDKSMQALFNNDAHLFGAFVIHFAYELAYPSNYVVEVSPDKPGKSVEWTKARSHLILLPAKAVQESQENGGLTRQQTGDIIQRCAHERRGHIRRLKAERYSKDDLGFKIDKNPLGWYKTVWIKDAWVGPEEWKSKDSQTVYRMRDFSAELTRK